MVKGLLLGVGIIFSIFVFNANSTYADDVDMTLNLMTSSTLILPSAPINLAIEPTSEGRFSSGSFNVAAYSNSPAGYTLTMTTTSVDLTSNTYNFATDTYPVIPTLSNNATESTFEMNKWGISLDGGTSYIPMVTEKTLADTTSTGAMANGVVTTIGIGAKLDLQTVPGKYSTTINFALVASAPPVSLEDSYAFAGKGRVEIDGEKYYRMQDMTSDICTNATLIDDELQVVDTRDNNIYWILKARDGKCWMTENLDLDLETTPTNVAALTPDNTDITANWTPVNATINVSSGIATGWVDDLDAPYSVNVGDWYYTDTWYDADTDCPSTEANNRLGCNYLSGNANNKFNTSTYPNNGRHGRVGNYYNWPAAIAVNDASSYSSSTYSNPENNPSSSICPKGWKLPVVTTYTEGIMGTNDFYNLIKSYNSSLSDDVTLTASPLYFTRGGYLANGNLLFVGWNGNYWSSTVGESGSVYFLSFTSGGNDPTHTYGRVRGTSIRCIAR